MMISRHGSGDGVRMERTRIRRMLGSVKLRLALVRSSLPRRFFVMNTTDGQKLIMTHELLLELSEKQESPRTKVNMLEMSL